MKTYPRKMFFVMPDDIYKRAMELDEDDFFDIELPCGDCEVTKELALRNGLEIDSIHITLFEGRAILSLFVEDNFDIPHAWVKEEG